MSHWPYAGQLASGGGPSDIQWSLDGSQAIGSATVLN